MRTVLLLTAAISVALGAQWQFRNGVLWANRAWSNSGKLASPADVNRAMVRSRTRQELIPTICAIFEREPFA